MAKIIVDKSYCPKDKSPKISEITHYCPVDMEESYCLCGEENPHVMVSTGLCGVKCLKCIEIARKISKDVADLYAFGKGLMQDGSIAPYVLKEKEKRKKIKSMTIEDFVNSIYDHGGRIDDV